MKLTDPVDPKFQDGTEVIFPTFRGYELSESSKGIVLFSKRVAGRSENQCFILVQSEQKKGQWVGVREPFRVIRPESTLKSTWESFQ